MLRFYVFLISAWRAESFTYDTNLLNPAVFAAVRDDNNAFLWGDAAYGNAFPATALTSIRTVASTGRAFAAITTSGHLFCWGDSTWGGDCSSLSGVTGVTALFSSSPANSGGGGGAFAALTSTGSVHAWGHSFYGGDTALVAELLVGGVVTVYSCGNGFVAHKSDGTLVPWSTAEVGDASSVAEDIAGDVIRVYGNGAAFCALKTEGTVYCWGSASYGGIGYVSAVSNAVDIFVTEYAFAAIDSAGVVYAWGDGSFGGTIPSGTISNVATVYSGYYAFAALKKDGTVSAWGSSSFGGDTSFNPSGAITNVVSMYGNLLGFVALKSSGGMVGWGTLATPPASMGSIVQVVMASDAWAALNEAGTVFTWGSPASTAMGATTSTILSQNTAVKLYSSDFAFAAVYGSASGFLTCWGLSTSGGDCTSIALAGQLFALSYVFGSEYLLRVARQTPSWSPTAHPSAVPSSAVPSTQPIRPTAQPTYSQEPTSNPQGFNLFPTDSPSASPTALPSQNVAPVLSGTVANMKYYCRPRNYAYAKNTWQRVDPRITIYPAVGIVTAWVTISGYTKTDELSLEGRYSDDNHDIHAVFDAVSGTLTLSRNEGVTSPVDWADVLSNINYRLSDHLKPCKDYRHVYTRTFNFYVQDRFKRVSNVFSKGLTIETASVVYTGDNTVNISQRQHLDVGGESSKWIENRRI